MKKNTRYFVFLMVLITISILLMNVEVTSVYIILQPIRRSLDISNSQITWVVNLYLITFAAFIIVAGKLGDRFGHKSILTIGLIILILMRMKL